MKKIRLGNTPYWVTPLGMGVLTIGENQLQLPLQEGAAVVRHAMDRGIRFLDTAQYYHTYPYIKEALKGTSYNPVIVSKSLDHTYSQMMEAIEDARRSLDRDIIEIFLMHEVRENPDWLQRRGAWEALQEAKARGLVGAIGVSTHHVDVAENMSEVQECDVVFPLINVQGLGIRDGSGFGTKEEMHKAIVGLKGRGKGIFAMKAFGGGNLIHDYQKCLDYITGIPEIDSLMIGFGNLEEIDRAVDYFLGRLPEEYAPDISKKRIMIDPGDCEGCGACIERCPNHAIFMGMDGIAKVDPKICLTCGYCGPVCPTRAILFCEFKSQ